MNGSGEGRSEKALLRRSEARPGGWARSVSSSPPGGGGAVLAPAPEAEVQESPGTVQCEPGPCACRSARGSLRALSSASVPLADPTMLSLDFLDDVRRMNKRQLYYQVLNFGMIVSSALMIWKGLMVITGSESPIVVVLSGSMEPAFHRGDLLFLTNRVEDPIRVGEIVVFRIEGREIPIVHRVLKIHEKQNGHIKFLTKGDNNAVDDRGLYKQGQHWLEKKDVVGRARGFVPYIGIVTILMNDYPKFKYAVLFLLGLFVLVHRE
ncbi:signal peptidase complex catalytic subunit SEC11A [Tupaia chinensis]|uniref:signal peptidase complex catalytic subunit SEC11A n=1 Tax=Tupaia chinensis TaxID=246437 RepID=UPI000FFBFB04|nr:signal peptidase complex catalytic subunit SEC11A [Tupaia chinensis]